MNFDLPSIVVGLVFSAIGWVYFSYGRKQAEVKIIVTGVALMVYVYFVESLAVSVSVGLLLAALPFIFKWW